MSEGQRRWPPTAPQLEYRRGGQLRRSDSVVNFGGQLRRSTLWQHTLCSSGRPAPTQTCPAELTAKHDRRCPPELSVTPSCFGLLVLILTLRATTSPAETRASSFLSSRHAQTSIFHHKTGLPPSCPPGLPAGVYPCRVDRQCWPPKLTARADRWSWPPEVTARSSRFRPPLKS